jgi:hypothetical protein
VGVLFCPESGGKTGQLLSLAVVLDTGDEQLDCPV